MVERQTTEIPLSAALYPIDTIKTRLQLARTGGGIRALLQSGGGKALYAGVFGNLVGVAPATAVFMAIYEPLKQVTPHRRSGRNSTWWHLYAAACLLGRPHVVLGFER